MSKEITITVNYGRNKTKEYSIGIVPNRFNVDFMEYCTAEARVKEIDEKIKSSKDAEEKEILTKELIDMDLEKILKSKYDLIATILLANEYIEDKKEFDSDFWDKKVSYLDIDSFLTQCFAKDKDMNALKKKLQNLKVN